LVHFSFLRAKVINLGLELDTIINAKLNETRTEEIEALALACREYDSLGVQKGSVSDLTAFVAANYETIARACYKQSERQVIYEIQVLGNLVQKIENALSMLKPKELQVIELRYIHKLAWVDIQHKTKLSRQRCNILRLEAMRKLQRVLYLNEEERILLAEYIERGEIKEGRDNGMPVL